MEHLEKAAVNEWTAGLKTNERVIERATPPASEFLPLIGLYFAKKHEKENKPTTLDSSTVKPIYFFGAWAEHVSALIFGLSYIVYLTE